MSKDDIGLREDAELLRRALDAMPMGVLVIDSQGRPIAQNESFESLTGDYQADALLRSSIDEVTSQARQQMWQSQVVDVHGPALQTFEISSQPLGDAGNIVLVDDISERRRLDAVRRDFVANVSHELRTPVGAIALSIETLEDETDVEAATMLRRHIAAEADRAKRLIDELLTLSRMEAAPPRAAVEVSMAEVVQRAVNGLAPCAEERSIRIEVDDLPSAMIMGNADELQSAVANLLENAVKYSDADATVSLRLKNLGDSCVLTVSDEGIGIPARDIDRIFERFYRVDRARSRDTGGSGLGLAIVRHAVTNHGGTVEVESREGEGSVFTIAIPLAS